MKIAEGEKAMKKGLERIGDFRRRAANAYEKTFMEQAANVGKADEAQLIDRNWTTVAEPIPGNKDQIRVLSFNILAHGLSDVGGGFSKWYKPEVTPDHIRDAIKAKKHDDMLEESRETDLLFRKKGTKGGNLTFSERHKRILGLILTENPSVITLQEVDRYDEFSKALDSCGYDSVFQPKLPGACMRGNGQEEVKDGDKVVIEGIPGKSDGVAIFWDKNRIRPVGGLCDSQLPSFKKGERVFGKSKQACVSQKLEMIDSGKQFRVFTVHAKSGKAAKDFPDKAEQGKFLAERMRHYAEAGERVILAGDFNFDMTDNAFNLFYNGEGEAFYYGPKDNERLYAGESNPELGAKNFMQSSYPVNLGFDRPTAVKWRKGGQQPKKICDALDQKNTIDFIMHSKNKIRTLRTLQVPTLKETLKRTTVDGIAHGLPNWCYPSDHYSICADLELC